MNEIITVEQAVKLTSRFDEIAAELNEKKARVEALLVSEESRKDAKEIRAALNKDAKAYAEDFKAIKAQVLKPWNDVEAEYKSKIDAPFKEMDKLLKEKIDFIEDGLKAEKKTELLEYFEEYKLALGVTFVEFLDLDIKVGLSQSLTALKKEVKEKLDGIFSDVSAIGKDAEVLAEYQRNGFKLSLAIQTVADRQEAIRQAEELRAKRQAEAEAEAKRVAEMEKIAAEHAPEPVEVKVEPKEEKVLCVGFRVYGTLEQLKALKAYLIENEYKFETV